MGTKKEYGNLSIKQIGDKYAFVDSESGVLMVDPIFDEVRKLNDLPMFIAIIGGSRVIRVRDYYVQNQVSVWNEAGTKLLHLTKSGTIMDFPINIVKGYGVYSIDGHAGIVNESHEIIIQPTFDHYTIIGEQIILLDRLMTDLEKKHPLSHEFFIFKNLCFLKSLSSFSKEFFQSEYDVDVLQDYDFCFYDQELKLVIIPRTKDFSIARGGRKYFLENKFGLISEDGRKITANIYDRLALDWKSNSVYRYSIDGKIGFINEAGQKIKKNAGEWYQRVCENCGRAWFVSVKDETKIAQSLVTYRWEHSFHYKELIDLARGDLIKKRSCPYCGSTNCVEDIL